MKLTEKKTIAGVGVMLALFSGGVVVVTAVSGADSDDQPSQPLARSSTAAPPAAILTMLKEQPGVLAEFDLDPSKAKGYTLGATDASIWVMPGREGSGCLIDEEGAAVCAPAEQLAERGLVLIRPPLPPREYGPALAAAQRAGLQGEELRQAVRKKLAKIPRQSGPATYFGYAPPGTTTVRLLDGTGKTIAQTQAVDRVYDFRVEDFAADDPQMIQIDRGAGQKAIMSGRLPGPLY